MFLNQAKAFFRMISSQIRIIVNQTSRAGKRRGARVGDDRCARADRNRRPMINKFPKSKHISAE
jgi:hypothetical protein